MLSINVRSSKVNSFLNWNLVKISGVGSVTVAPGIVGLVAFPASSVDDDPPKVLVDA